MSKQIVPQDEAEVKCDYDGCQEEVFREGLCWQHFMEEKLAEWNDQDAERETCLRGVGYVFGDPVDRTWYGCPIEEVCR
jgi:hypothetical protein